ncbi:MAG: membrane protein insertase YidC [Gammaproteobacteria bacterium]|nr:membrane protein insertase YidC [Gammaproteobacteria bacterium]
MDTQKIILIAAFFMTSMMLWQAWDKHNHPEKYQQLAEQKSGQVNNADASNTLINNEAPAIPVNADKNLPEKIIDQQQVSSLGNIVNVKTDVFDINISTQGADIRKASLLTYPIDVNHNKNPVVLLDETPAKYYIIQTGVLSKNENKNHIPDHKVLFSTEKNSYQLDGKDKLDVSFKWLSNDNKIELVKNYTFTKGSYEIIVKQTLINRSDIEYKGHFYRQLQRNNPGQQSRLLYTYTGGMLYREGGGFEKYSFDDMEEEVLNRTITKGWLAMIEHYFLSSWIPNEKETQYYYTRAVKSDYLKPRYILGMTSEEFSVPVNMQYTHQDTLFIGPKLQDTLKQIHPNLHDTVDFGFLSVIAHPIFWLLDNIHKFLGNWGWSIIVLTLIIKLIFYKLSEYSYRSMAEMRKLGPKLKALQEQHKDNPQAKNEAMMKMYKEEKINPLGGCLPVLVQIPVFIALYWVLLESVELRQADFALWLNNLSAPDPYYILPLVMGVTMFIQQKLNPAPPDPIQAKVMMMLPFIFTVFFAFFPSGLVLYWVTNNILSITQQWFITKQIEKK